MRINVNDIEIFRMFLESKLLAKSNHAKAKPYEVEMIFTIMIVQRHNGLGDPQTEY